MSATDGTSKVPVIDDKSDSFDRWEIQWNVLAEVEGIIDSLGPKLDSKMLQNNNHMMDPSKEMDIPMIVADKDNKRAMTSVSLAFKTMKLLRLITNTKTED
jgi:hypothetical protein